MSTTDILIKNLAKTLTDVPEKRTKAYDTQAEVRRIEGNTAWVHIPGGVDETPVQLTTSAKKGDIVQVRVSGGRAWLYGNASAPPTDDTKANEADKKAGTAHVVAVEAKDTADVAEVKAVVAKETAESILVYDHSYVLQTIDNELWAVFTAAVYQGGKNIITRFPEDMFAWYIKSENSITGTTDKQFLNTGYQTQVKLKDCGYGSEVISIFSPNEDSELLSSDESNLTDSSNTNYTVRSSGESVRVRDLQTSTNLYDAEKIMVVGISDEHLITAETLYNYILSNLNNDFSVIYCGSATELVG